MNKKIFVKKYDDNNLPKSITPELANMYIRIHGDDYHETGNTYFYGTIRVFVFEKKPLPELIEMLTKLENQSSYNYRLNKEVITVERVDNPKLLSGRYRFIRK